jgi:hypothetical protein
LVGEENRMVYRGIQKLQSNKGLKKAACWMLDAGC